VNQQNQLVTQAWTTGIWLFLCERLPRVQG